MSKFSNIKVGDTVFVGVVLGVNAGGWGSRRHFTRDFITAQTVDRVTSTQFTAGGKRYSKTNGGEIGGVKSCMAEADREVSTLEEINAHFVKVKIIESQFKKGEIDLTTAVNIDHALAVAKLMQQARDLLADKNWNADSKDPLAGVLDELCDFKSALDGMLMSGMGSDEIIEDLDKRLSHYGVGGAE